VNSIESRHFVPLFQFASGNKKNLCGSTLIEMPAEVEFDVGLSSPALHQRNHARSHDNKSDENGKRFKVPFAHSMADLHQASEVMLTHRVVPHACCEGAGWAECDKSHRYAEGIKP
jgi:hypothetical protein